MPDPSPALILDPIAANTWPAAHVHSLASWQLRANPALPSRRSSSVLAYGDYPAIADWMPPIEQYYKQHGLPVRFQLSPSSPPGLDDQLARLGFVIEMQSHVMIADTDKVIANSRSPAIIPYAATIRAEAGSDWITAYMAIEQFNPDLTPAYQEMMKRIPGIKRFVLLQDQDQARPVAVGTVIVEDGWAGLINVATSEAYRRQGIAQHLLKLLGETSAQLGAWRMYLQMLASNEAAGRLYRKAGFEFAYGYHYRTAPGF